MKELGIIRIAAVSPKVFPGNPEKNAEYIIKSAEDACKSGAAIAVFPALALSGATCGDAFFHETLQRAQAKALQSVAKATEQLDILVVLGIFLRAEDRLINCSAAIQGGEIIGVVPGSIPRAPVGMERYFSEDIPFEDLLFEDPESGFRFMLSPETPAVCGLESGFPDVTTPAKLSAHAVLCSGTGFDFPAREQLLKDAVRVRSGNTMSAIILAESGMYESTAEAVYAGECMVAAGGRMLADARQGYSQPEGDAGIMAIADVDFSAIEYRRLKSASSGSAGNSYNSGPDASNNFNIVNIEPLTCITFKDSLISPPSPMPYLSNDAGRAGEELLRLFEMQALALATKLRNSGIKKIVLGVSGGSDSTLAMLVAARALRLSDLPPSNLIAVTMPGPGTGKRSLSIATRLMRILECDSRRISINRAVSGHLRDIGHKKGLHDITYENAQARERTQILMDIANMEGGMVAGTGDMSEAALGWCTYNGDHMSMYGINAGLPKSLVKKIIGAVAENVRTFQNPAEFLHLPLKEGKEKVLANILDEALASPISPELLPPDKDGNITQRTEDRIGPYEVHDFYIYHMLANGASPRKLLFLAMAAFEGRYSREELVELLSAFINRFFSQQFKRSASPDGPMLVGFGLSPKGGLNLPSDLDASAWRAEVEELKSTNLNDSAGHK